MIILDAKPPYCACDGDSLSCCPACALQIIPAKYAGRQASFIKPPMAEQPRHVSCIGAFHHVFDVQNVQSAYYAMGNHGKSGAKKISRNFAAAVLAFRRQYLMMRSRACRALVILFQVALVRVVAVSGQGDASAGPTKHYSISPLLVSFLRGGSGWLFQVLLLYSGASTGIRSIVLI